MLGFQRGWLAVWAAFVVAWPVGASLAAWPAVARAEPDLAAVAAHVRAHDPRGALSTLDRLPVATRRAPAARYLRGRLLERLGQPARAAELFAELSDADLPAAVLRDVRWRRARLRARSGRCDAAHDDLVVLGRRADGRGQVARALAAECALRQGRFEEAVGQLQAVAREDAERVDTVAVRLHLASALDRLKRRDEAIEELRRLLVDRPEHPDIGRAEHLLRRWDAQPDLSIDDRLARAARLLRLGRHDAVRAELEEAGRPRERSARGRWLHLMGMALYRSRHHYGEAAKTLARAARLGGPTAIDDEFHAARALSRADRDSAAVQAYRRLVRRHPRHRRAVQAEYLAAWLELHHGRRRGERRMEAFLRGPRGRVDAHRARAAVWHLALAAFERSAHARAAELFERYARLGPGGMVEGRGRYWLGRAYEASGAPARAEAAYRQAIEAEPLHWYAVLAAARLRGMGKTPHGPFPEEPAADEPDLPPEADGPPRLSLPAEVAFYQRLGLMRDARQALHEQEEGVLGGAPAERRFETLAAAYHRVGEYARPFRLLAVRRHGDLARPARGRNRWVWDALYPRPWRSRVEAEARAQRVEPAFLYAVMRQESAYDTEAVSYAGAIGLLQVMPTTGRRLAEDAGTDAPVDLLFDPAWNVRLGARHVAEALEDYDGHLPLAAAAFNAGPGAVSGWLEERGDMELDHFVERIPYQQTRNYVRRVMTHYARYRYLEAPEAGWPDVDLEMLTRP